MCKASPRARSAPPGESDGRDGHLEEEVSRLCEAIDERVKSFLDRPLEGDWPYVWLAATYVKVRQTTGSFPSR